MNQEPEEEKLEQNQNDSDSSGSNEESSSEEESKNRFDYDKNFKDIENVQIKLYMIDFKQCDPKRCSGRKLQRHGKLKTLNHKQKFHGLVLSASGDKIISKADLDLVKKSGLCVIDCSWNKISTVTARYQNERQLPYLICVNQVNFGTPYKLNCAEALAAGLFILGFWQQAGKVLASFSWGMNFYTINKDLFDLYATCLTSSDLNTAQNNYQEELIKEQEIKQNKRFELPPQSSSDEEEDQNQS